MDRSAGPRAGHARRELSSEWVRTSRRRATAVPYAETLALGVMVIVLTYVSLILGELVPKRLALTHPEAIASIIARPINVLATVGRPIVTLLSVSTDTILRSF